uniref:SUEL-type lectin domain-containing protein n=1 Tax=Sinocyclocheilus rhinocerous TaxID=307959 RepID=A0A673GBX3_9TELE
MIKVSLLWVYERFIFWFWESPTTGLHACKVKKHFHCLIICIFFNLILSMKNVDIIPRGDIFSIFYYMCSDLGFIKVLEANYGRTDHITCANGSPTNVISNKHCFLETSLHTMSARYSQIFVINCSVPAVNSVFSDPCSRTFKYLDVSYDCIPARIIRGG